MVVGFTSGAAITIALQQLKGLLGYTSFTDATNIVSVLSFVFSNTYLVCGVWRDGQYGPP